MGGIARNDGLSAVSVGGTENHVHVLMMPAQAPAKGVQLIKGNSSRWINDTIAPQSPFSWQEGYGIFTIGFSQIGRTRTYIEGQREHHRRISFEDEVKLFVRKHMIEIREDYLFG
jgi:REP element-mobilizing transposase RayT